MKCIKQIKHFLQHFLGKLSLHFFCNTLGFSLNFKWYFYHLVCRMAYKKTVDMDHYLMGDNDERLESIRLQGFATVSQNDCESLSRKVEEYFSQQPVAREMVMDKESACQLAPLIFDVLSNNSAFLKHHYKSSFQTYWITIQRMTVGETSSDSSYGWHIDDNPRELNKLFLYLNDVTKDNGAFRAFNYKSSKKIFANGFVSNTVERRVASHNIVETYLAEHPEDLKIMGGKAGTLLAFDNNLVHKGTSPLEGYRDSVHIEIYPSRSDLTLANVEASLATQIKYDYPRNPFFNDIFHSRKPLLSGG